MHEGGRKSTFTYNRSGGGGRALEFASSRHLTGVGGVIFAAAYRGGVTRIDARGAPRNICSLSESSGGEIIRGRSNELGVCSRCRGIL